MSYSVEQRNVIKESIENMQNLFEDLFRHFTVRMMNTFDFILIEKGKKEAMEYVKNYLTLYDLSRIDEITQKINSSEFKEILDVLAQLPAPEKRFNNNRLKFYFGPVGSGIQDKIYKEEDVEGTFCCNENIRAFPEDVDPIKDKEKEIDILSTSPTLREALEKGKTIVFDEIDFLHYSAIKLLEEIIKSKDEFMCNNELIKIHPNFKIIFIVRLPSVHIQKSYVPIPLIDRSSEIRRFKKKAVVYKKKAEI